MAEPCRVGKGPRRERDDRRPAAQRHGPDRQDWVGRPGATSSTSNATRRSTADRRGCRPTSRRERRRRGIRALPMRSVTGAPKVRRCRSSPRQDSLVACTTAQSGSSPKERMRPARVSTCRSAPWCSTRGPTAEYGVGGRHHVGLGRRVRVRRGRGQGRRADRPQGRGSSSTRPCDTTRERGSSTWTAISRGSGSRAPTGFAFDEPAVVQALEQAASRILDRPAPARGRRSTGPVDVGVTVLVTSPERCAWRSIVAIPSITPTR